MIGSSNFLTSGAKLVFIKLKQVFFKALILHHFDPERYIRIEKDILGYAISGIFSQFTLKSQWHSMAFFSHKMILVEIKYKTNNGEVLAIIKAFKTWKHYLEST